MQYFKRIENTENAANIQAIFNVLYFDMIVSDLFSLNK